MKLTLEEEKVAALAMFGSHGLVGFDPDEKSKYGFLPAYLKDRFSIDVSQIDWNEMELKNVEDVTQIRVVAGPRFEPAQAKRVVHPEERLVQRKIVSRARFKTQTPAALLKTVRAGGVIGIVKTLQTSVHVPALRGVLS